MEKEDVNDQNYLDGCTYIAKITIDIIGEIEYWFEARAPRLDKPAGYYCLLTTDHNFLKIHLSPIERDINFFKSFTISVVITAIMMRSLSLFKEPKERKSLIGSLCLIICIEIFLLFILTVDIPLINIPLDESQLYLILGFFVGSLFSFIVSCLSLWIGLKFSFNSIVRSEENLTITTFMWFFFLIPLMSSAFFEFLDFHQLLAKDLTKLIELESRRSLAFLFSFLLIALSAITASHLLNSKNVHMIEISNTSKWCYFIVIISQILFSTLYLINLLHIKANILR